MSSDEVTRVSARLVDEIRGNEFQLDSGTIIRLTASMGVAEYPPFRDAPSALSWSQTVTLADKGLLYLKQDGRDGWCRVRPTPRVEPTTLSGHLDEDLRVLIEREEVSIERG